MLLKSCPSQSGTQISIALKSVSYRAKVVRLLEPLVAELPEAGCLGKGTVSGEAALQQRSGLMTLATGGRRLITLIAAGQSSPSLRYLGAAFLPLL